MDEQTVIVNEDKLFPAKDTQKVEDVVPFDQFDVTKEPPKDTKLQAVVTDAKPKAANPPMSFDKGLSPKTFDELWKLASLYFKAAVAPKKAGFDSVEKIAAALDYCSKKSLIFQSAVGNMVWINDRLTVWGELPGAICRMSGRLEKLDTISIDDEYKEICVANKNLEKDPMAFVTKIKVKDKDEKEYFYSKKDAERAGLLAKNDIWKGHWPIMMRRKSIGLALKFEMPDVLMGLAIAEYDFDTAPDLRDITPENGSTENYTSAKYGKLPVQAVAPIELPRAEETPNAGVDHLPPAPAVVS